MHTEIKELLAAHKAYLNAERESTDAEYERMEVELEEAKARLLKAPSTSPLTDQEISDIYFGATGQSLRPADMFLVRFFAHAVEARAKVIKAKPSHTDWSAA